MSSFAIRANGLSKRYRIGRIRNSFPTLRESLAAGAVNVATTIAAGLGARQGQRARPPEFWALKDASFEIGHGEVVGIIGNNGAGKSTLLKILSRIVEPTEGEAEINGRLGSLLEVGTGFHPELTGRDNIYLNGAILGMSRAAIARRFDEIVAFAEVEQFIDTPVKHYSSGMYLRLAFAVAAHLEPEILIVDEVLAVGDAAFQKKCLGKMGDVAKTGRTVLFVSHNMIATQALSERIIWLNGGRIVDDGEPGLVISTYLRGSKESLAERVWGDPVTAPGNDAVRLLRACVRPRGGTARDPIDVRTDYVMEFDYWNLRAGSPLSLSIHVTNEQGILVFNVGAPEAPLPLGVGHYRDVCEVPGDLMNDGSYRVELVVHEGEEILVRAEDLLVFDIVDSPDMRGNWYGHWGGVIRPILKWSTVALEALPAPPT